MIRVPVAPIGWPSAMPPPLTLTFSCGTPVSFIQASTTEANASLHSNRSMSSIVRPVFSSACCGGPDRAGQHPDRVVAADATGGGSGPAGSARGRPPPARRRPAARTRRRRSGEATAAVIRPPGASGSRPAIFSSDVSRGHWSVAKLCPSEGRPARSRCRTGPRRSRSRRALVGGQRELLHLLAADVPLLGDHLGGAELADLLVAVPRLPAGRLGERRGEAVLLADQHRRRDRDGAHVLHAAGDDEVLGAGHARPGRRSAPPAGRSRTAGRWSRRARGRAARPPARRCARRRRPASRWCRSSRGSRRRRRPGRRRCGR